MIILPLLRYVERNDFHIVYLIALEANYFIMFEKMDNAKKKL